MKKNIHDIDKIFRDALDDLHEAAPSSVWESVSHDLDKKQAAHFRQKYYRLKRTALVLLLLVFSTGIYLFYSSRAGKKSPGITSKSIAVTSAQPETSMQRTSTGAVVLRKNPPAENQTGTDENGFATTNNKKEELLPAANRTTKQLAGVQQNIPEDVKELTRPAIRKIKALTPFSSDAANQKNVDEARHSQKSMQSGVFAGIKKMQTSAPDVLNKNNTRASGKLVPAVSKQELSVANNLAKPGKNNQSVHPENIQTGNGNSIHSVTGYGYFPPLSRSVIDPINIYPLQPIDLLLPVGVGKNQNIKNAGKHASKSNIQPRFALTAFGAPNHSFVRLEDDKQPGGSGGYDKNEAQKSEQQGSSYSAGLLVNYGLTKHIVLQSGLVFSHATTNITTTKTIYAKPDNNGHARYEFNCSSGYSYINPKSGTTPAVGDSIRIMGSSSSISYIGVPLSLNYAIYAGKFTLMPGVGLSLNFLTNGNSATSFRNTAGNQKETAPIDGLKTAYMDASFGVGAAYMLNKRISVSLRPLMRLALTSINKNTPVKAYQNFASLEAGLKINL